jgi:hypothetical protein
MQPRHIRHPALVTRIAVRVERVDVDPSEIERVAGCPDDRSDPCRPEVERDDRIDDTGRSRADYVGFGLFGQVEPFAGDIGVGLAQDGQIIRIARRDGFGQIVGKVDDPSSWLSARPTR